MGYIKKLKNNELVGGTDKTTIYPVTSAEAVFEEVSDNEFKSQKYLNNHITNERIVDNTIENRKLKDDTIDMGKLNTQLKTIIQNAYDASWKVKEEPFSLETKYDANDVVYDPDTNSSYVSLTADNQGNPVKLEDEEEVNPYWRLVINGISAVESTKVINAKVEELETEVDNKIDDAQDQLDAKIADVQVQLDAVTQEATDAALEARNATSTVETLTSQQVADAQIGYFTCTDTAASGAAANETKITTTDTIGVSAYTKTVGSHVKVKMAVANTHATPVYLQFGSNTATRAELYYNGEEAGISNTWDDNETISVYYDGTYYQASNAMGGGPAVGKKKLNGTQGYYVDLSGETAPEATSQGGGQYFSYIKYPVKEGDVVEIKGKSSSLTALVWGLIDSTNSNIIVERAPVGADYSQEPFVKVIPSGVDYVIINNFNREFADYEWYFAKKGSIGSTKILTESYLYGNLKTLAVGTNYSAKEPVVTSNKQILRITQDILLLNLTDTVKQRELKTYNNATFQAQKDVKKFANTSLTGASVEEPIYALGSPTKLSLDIVREDCNIEVSFTNGTEIVGSKVNITPSIGYTATTIATAVYNALNALEDTGWTFTDKGNGSITAEYPAIEGYSDYNVVFSETSGIISTSTVSVTSTSTKITMAFSIGVGNISATFKGISYEISVGASTTSSQIASSIAEAFENTEGWIFESSGNIISATCLEAGDNSSTEFKLTDGILGVTYTLSKPWTGSNAISHYDGSDWYIDTLDTYSSSVVFANNETINEEWLIYNVTESDSLAKEIIEDEYATANAFKKQKDDYEQKITDDEYVIARAVGDHERRINNLEDNGGKEGGSTSLSGTLSSRTSDTICVIGSSFGVGYTISGKHWVNILSMFSDYSVQNMSADGSSNLTRLQALRRGDINPAPKAKYALLVNSENLGGGQTVLLHSFINLAKVIKSYGITPICGTSYRPSDGFRQMHYYFCSLLKNWCKQDNTLFMDAAQYYSVIGTGYNFERPGNTHLGTRQIPGVAYAYMDAISGLERPYQSLKTFSKRNEVLVNSLDDLMFSDNYGRSKLFKETTSYKDYALISAILPATANNLSKVTLSFNTTNSVNVYVINTIAKPYPSVPTYTRFHIDTILTTNPEVGDSYTYDNKYFTIVKIETEEGQHYGAYCDIYCNPSLPSSEEDISGVLTKTSGGGDSEIAFSSYGIATLASGDEAVVNADTIGHWELLEPDEENTNIYTLKDLIAKVSIDKINFLVESEGSFSLSNISIAWSASALKTNYQRTPKGDFTTNDWNSNSEIITESRFGSIGTSLSSWTDGNGDSIVSQATYEYSITGSLYTPGGQAVIKVGPTQYAQTMVNKSSLRIGKFVIEVIARFFGDGITTGFVNGTETVNSDTFDWAQLTVRVGGEENNYGSPTYNEFTYPIGLYWRIIRVPIDILGSQRYDMKLRLFADRNGVEIAKVSLKYI